MPGQVPLAEMGEHLKNARVSVVASVGFESFSYSTLEAMAAARPTVVTATGALPELIEHERSGLVVSPNEPHEMAAALERFLGDRNFSDSCRLAAHERAKRRFDTSVVLPQMIDSYRSAADFYYGDRDVPAVLRPPRQDYSMRSVERALASVA